jgi:hypothetical protein
MRTKKLSKAQQWAKDHPDDVPCPRDPNLAGVWRRKRGLEDTASSRALRAKYAKYEAAMAEKRAQQRPGGAEQTPNVVG